MTLLDTVLAMVLAVGIAASGMQLMNGGLETLKQQQRLGVYVATVPEVRMTMAKFVANASRVRVFESVDAARGDDNAGIALTGPAIRVEYSSGDGLPSGATNWQVTIEFRDGRLVYRNQDGAEWVITEASGGFELQQGVLTMELTRGETNAAIAVAVN